MKKSGFTLAEVLITLAIIGVIAALTLPGLMTDTASAQIGPKLAKAVSMFEQGNESLLNTFSVDSLTDTGLLDGDTPIVTYGDELSKHLKISPFTYPEGVTQEALDESTDASCTIGATFADGTPFISKDGTLYVINYNADSMVATNPAHKQRIGTVFVDTNGIKTPNAIGTDIFAFSLWNDGSLRPVGGANWSEGAEGECKWQDTCANNAAATDYNACAGAIFENNLKVLYK